MIHVGRYTGTHSIHYVYIMYKVWVRYCASYTYLPKMQNTYSHCTHGTYSGRTNVITSSAWTKMQLNDDALPILSPPFLQFISTKSFQFDNDFDVYFIRHIDSGTNIVPRTVYTIPTNLTSSIYYVTLPSYFNVSVRTWRKNYPNHDLQIVDKITKAYTHERVETNYCQRVM